MRYCAQIKSELSMLLTILKNWRKTRYPCDEKKTNAASEVIAFWVTALKINQAQTTSINSKESQPLEDSLVFWILAFISTIKHTQPWVIAKCIPFIAHSDDVLVPLKRANAKSLHVIKTFSAAIFFASLSVVILFWQSCSDLPNQISTTTISTLANHARTLLNRWT